MSQKSLGLIETFGLLAGVEAADAAVKSANVKLIGYELSRGSGMTTIKVEGDVGAVKAAISAAEAAANKVGRVASVKVIPRPSASLEGMVRNADTVGYSPAEPSTEPDPPAEEPPKKPQTAPPVPAVQEQAKQAVPAKKEQAETAVAKPEEKDKGSAKKGAAKAPVKQPAKESPKASRGGQTTPDKGKQKPAPEEKKDK